ncbi:AroM family protein [Clostridium sp. chh4-2]|uniref:AroM family protein n=1 Tax=Clostridium sp. chh4-2 TaxID=2067550 RepID=UPI000CCE571F|nr:AroM family protein [Clostridium sp. chh4-2]PNV60374.1 AroM family protein [Clostridium sp. chh4-2]
MKIGAVTIGQAPRVDVTVDIMDIFNGKIELLQRGGLDGLTKEQIAEFKPEEGDYVLVSRLTDGTSMTFAERYILPRLQECINELEAEGVRLIMFFCTGDFPDSLTANVPLVYPCNILNKVVPLLTKKSNIVTVTPSPLQVEQCEKKWSEYVETVKAIPASPYGSWEDLKQAAETIKGMDADLVVLDCIGFTQEMKNMFARETGKLVVLPRTLLARVISELTDVE